MEIRCDQAQEFDKSGQGLYAIFFKPARWAPGLHQNLDQEFLHEER